MSKLSAGLHGYHLAEFSNGGCPIAGYCCRLDTHFVSVTNERLEGDRLNLTSVDLGVVAEIDLRLIEVHWFRRLIDVIPRGHSAGLKFDGLGMEVIESALLQKRDREYVLIRA